MCNSWLSPTASEMSILKNRIIRSMQKILPLLNSRTNGAAKHIFLPVWILPKTCLKQRIMHFVF